MNIQLILENHRKWLNNEQGGERANLRHANLRYANLRDADLSYANLRDANLRYANLRDANLSDANLSYANLSDADLRGADLRDADLRDANLRGADLRYADLRYADLRGADLSDADLRHADLRYANLRYADLSNVKANDKTSFYHLQCPQEGEFIGYKKVRLSGSVTGIIKLLILEDSLRSSATSRKCRASKVKVLEIQSLTGDIKTHNFAYSQHDRDFKYEVGQIIEIKDFDTDRWVECTSGIHFFITRDEAVSY